MKKNNYLIFQQDLLADLETPVSLYLKLSLGSTSSFLLESVEQGETLGRHSFLGFDPEAVYELHPTHWEVSRDGVRKKIRFKDPLEILRSELRAKLSLGKEGDTSYPNFLGGFVGFFSYESVQYFESIRLRAKKDFKGLPLAILFKVHRFILFDHIERKMKLVSLYPAGEGRARAENKFKREVEKITKLLKKPIQESKRNAKSKSEPKFSSNLSQKEFIRRVNRIKDYIRAGDCIQTVYSQRFDLGRLKDSFDFYRILRSLNPSPYMFFYKHKNLELAGSSPEMLVRKKGNIAEARPIAGTRPRGLTDAKDKQYETQLKNSVKERAEHLMLVDLARNDLGRVCDFESVEVKEFERVERYSHVMHLVSDVQGKLKREKDALDLLKATFPAGTLSGAPKVRAMEIIDELEDSTRGPYGGCLGYFSYNGDMDMCITIRTLINSKGRASVQAGAGIVFDSDPRKEYEECLTKAKALFNAFKLTGSSH